METNKKQINNSGQTEKFSGSTERKGSITSSKVKTAIRLDGKKRVDHLEQSENRNSVRRSEIACGRDEGSVGYNARRGEAGAVCLAAVQI
jgi:hypothetical protein